ncbi:Wzz/FepE/Etk N-terminal domain-containing protein [Nonomuraea jiangxiensis]|uniref:Chain length determinant protein n=1 Tax=Nonomuraea jiangxiensis TaxID=633440 RepID=A0A1G8NVW9_9ACTN|nr:Wzz/FepE/Etk N-terminal domain-containing protein [Nonomuraea jiangxiensis]SDI84344.1 Chain length determinant protein [Nonomuraea jiangxiensis]
MSSGTDLDEHLALLRRRWLVLLGCVVFGGTAGLALMRLTPPAYTATTQVLVMPVGGQEPGNQVTARQREPLNLDTEAQIARSAVVAARAAKALGGGAPEPAEVSVPPNSSVLWISVTAAEPAGAAARSRAYAEAYLANRRESTLTAMAEQQQAVLAKLRQVNAAIDLVIKQLGGLPRGSAEHTIATQRQGVLNRQAATLALKYDALRTVAVTPGTIISQATPPTGPSSPSLPLYLGTGLMTGLLAGSAAAYARDRLDRRLRTAADVERLTGLRVLADLSGPRGPGVLHDLACAVVAACEGATVRRRLLVKALPSDLYASSLAEPLSVSAPLSVLDGSDVRDLARADAALLLVGLGRVTSTEVATAARGLAQHDVPVVGVVTATDAVPSFVPLMEPHTSLGKLVATGELEVSVSAETTPMHALHRRRRPRNPT